MNIDVFPKKIIGVYKLKREGACRWNTNGRPFAVLSVRLRGEAARFGWSENGKEKSACVASTDVGYFPSGAIYDQRSGNEQVICVHYVTENAIAGTANSYPQFEYGAAELVPLFESLYTVYARKEIGYEALGMSVLFKIIYRLRSRRPNLCEKVKSAVDENFSDPEFSLASLADTFSFSETYLRRVFKAEFRVGLSDYLISVRLDTAASMLSSGYYSVREVACACGYADPKYFSTAFKRRFGVKPTEYAAKTARNR